MKHIVLRLVLFVFVALVAGRSSATVTPLGYWRLGENDPGALPGDPCLPFTVDSTGNADLQRGGTLAQNNAFYTDNISLAAANRTGSDLGIRFDNVTPTDPVRYVKPTDPCLGCTNNYGVETWVRSGTLTQPDGAGIVFYGEDAAGGNSYRMHQTNQSYGLSITHGSDSDNVGFVPVVVGEWVHLAMVVDSGVTKFFVDGTLQGSVGFAPDPPQGCFGIAGYNDTSRFGASQGFFGSFDEVRSFTFEPGQFSPDDLLVNQPAVPEPGSMVLLATALAGLQFRLLRRRREPFHSTR